MLGAERQPAQPMVRETLAVMHPREVATAAEALRTVLDAVESGALHATPEQAAYLRGATETLERLTGEATCPQCSGQQDSAAEDE